MTEPFQLIVGAGPVGTALALRLADGGSRVRVVTRSGGGASHPLVERVALDASDARSLADAAHGASVVYNCANPGSYPLWEQVWPPLAASILHAAESAGAVLVTMGNLYGYGPVDGPMRRETPLRPSDHKGALRARMWEEALAAHQAGRVRVTEARASDYLGPTAPVSSGLLPRYAERTLTGRPATVFGDPDAPHSWTAVDDIAATLAVLGRDERAWGSAWLVPSNPPVSVREVLRALGSRVGAGEPRLRRMPRWAAASLGAVVPVVREVRGVHYQFDRPFVVDASETTEVFGITPTDWDALLDATAASWRDRIGR
ncbi:nucleoside-diphosphate-sugar epimerase [Agromyces flavus]|uniref:Nucleoside-diphosphate-sugar epimerase n=1 Tax=Agromyces flavus TaxID=589382 RepID=A0A1H1WXL2_9MICO|nr:NAD-dependent epimerase/dehydratase family protein [Agromyces flavus]MCP2366282.1 nucleoside-diphosphate-sugar epimerase [Agromyces flavus]GGI44362.1 NAD-dependent epimerase [Agromyces flavus]SDT01888.1 Nucleoside-diphosphate-sugar epimerase [Agromyces flavus]